VPSLRRNVRWNREKSTDFREHDWLSTIFRSACKQRLVDPNLRRQWTTMQHLFVTIGELLRGWSVVVNRTDVGDVRVFPTIVIDHRPRGIEPSRRAYHPFDESVLSCMFLTQTRKAHALV